MSGCVNTVKFCKDFSRIKKKSLLYSKFRYICNLSKQGLLYATNEINPNSMFNIFIDTLIKQNVLPCWYVAHSVSENSVPVIKRLQQTHLVETTWRLETTLSLWVFRQIAEQIKELSVWFVTSTQEEVGRKLLLTNRCCNTGPGNVNFTEALKYTHTKKKWICPPMLQLYACCDSEAYE